MWDRSGYDVSSRLCVGALLVTLLGASCGDNDPGIYGFLPEIPAPTGEPQVAFAGPITFGNMTELIDGPAATGMVGDFFLRNDKVRFVISAPTRVIGVIPQGGNLVDAALAQPGSVDHFGELGLVYLLGRTCEHQRLEVVQDGAGGGVAAIRAFGKSANNDFINVKGMGALPIAADIDPELPDAIECATTYILAPGEGKLRVFHTLYNPGSETVTGPMGIMADTGGKIDSWGNLRGFERLGVDAIATAASSATIDYVVYQGPQIAYGLWPHHDTPTTHASFQIGGVSFFLNGIDALLDLLKRDKYFLNVGARGGMTQRYDFVVGKAAAEIDAQVRAARGEAMRAVTGTVRWTTGGGVAGARVGFFRDDNGDGQLGDKEPIISYVDTDSDGRFAAEVPAAVAVLARAELKDVARSTVLSAMPAELAFSLPAPLRVGFSVIDDESQTPMPARLLAVGARPFAGDSRMFDGYDALNNVVQSQHVMRGTSTDLGDGADPEMLLPAGGSYRIYATRGTEYGLDSHAVTGTGQRTLAFRLRRVAPAQGYFSTEWHVHQVGSPDSPVLSEERLASAVSAGVEMFAVTDHDVVSDLQPLVASLGLTSLTRAVAGIEVTPFAYGHFNAWPLDVDLLSPNHGAVDWAQGQGGFAMTPAQIFAGMRERGAKMVQINHPRSLGVGQFQAFFDRANLRYDFDARVMDGDFANAAVPNAWLRLPEASLWSDQWNSLEVWNGLGTIDSDSDGRLEVAGLDRVMADWFSMLSMGFVVVPTGNSDTHTLTKDPMGMPRTYVRVPDDSAAALTRASSVDDVVATTAGLRADGSAVPRDVVVSNGPMLSVVANGQPALGRTLSAAGGAVTFTVTITSPHWAEVDTLEVFANATPVAPAQTVTALVPLKCYTSRAPATMAASDPCLQASLAPELRAFGVETLGASKRYRAVIEVTLDADDIRTRAGAAGRDAWLVFRVRGNRGIFPMMADGLLDDAGLAVALSGDLDAFPAAFANKGVIATAFTSPVFVDFDGGGYRAPFAP